MRPRALLALGVLAGTAALAVPASAAAPAGMHLGFYDSSISFDGSPVVRAAWLDRLSGIKATRLRIGVDWSEIATRAPNPGENTADPAWPGYRWAPLDGAVAEASARGLDPILTPVFAPRWAEGPGRPSSGRAGAWRPDPTALAAFARAATLRYPTVRYWQAWNEPNLDTYLSPQWVSGRAAAPAHYRRMLNAFYAAVKSVDPADVVITAGTAPFGDPGTKGARMRPARFVRELLCLRGLALRPARCPNPAKFDALSHHPYSVGGPRRAALNTDDVSVPDLAKLTRPLRRAERTGRALPRKRHRVWVTELSWDSSPPDPDGVPAQRHARWLEESLYVLWRAGVDTVTWFLARDQAPAPSFGETYQSGVFLRDGTPKPAATAFAFPFVGIPVRDGRVRLWGKAPSADAVTVQRRTGAGWVRVAGFGEARPGRIFTRSVRLRRGTKLRAVSGSATSLTWSVR